MVDRRKNLRLSVETKRRFDIEKNKSNLSVDELELKLIESYCDKEDKKMKIKEKDRIIDFLRKENKFLVEKNTFLEKNGEVKK